MTLVNPKFCGKCLAPSTVTLTVLSFGECTILSPSSGSKFTDLSAGLDTLLSPLSKKLFIFAIAIFSLFSYHEIVENLWSIFDWKESSHRNGDCLTICWVWKMHKIRNFIIKSFWWRLCRWVYLLSAIFQVYLFSPRVGFIICCSLLFFLRNCFLSVRLSKIWEKFRGIFSSHIIDELIISQLFPFAYRKRQWINGRLINENLFCCLYYYYISSFFSWTYIIIDNWNIWSCRNYVKRLEAWLIYPSLIGHFIINYNRSILQARGGD